jgi:hypothetical protein
VQDFEQSQKLLNTTSRKLLIQQLGGPYVESAAS